MILRWMHEKLQKKLKLKQYEVLKLKWKKAELEKKLRDLQENN